MNHSLKNYCFKKKKRKNKPETDFLNISNECLVVSCQVLLLRRPWLE